MDISNKEKIQITIKNTENETFYITKDLYSGVFSIYKDQCGKLIRLGKGTDPVILENKYVWGNE